MAAPLPQPGGHAYQFLATSPLDGILTSISVAIYGGLLLTMPIATYQLYAFLIPAVSEQHHRSLRPLTLMIPTLFIVGVAAIVWHAALRGQNQPSGVARAPLPHPGSWGR
jgi:sec-independent protein translocase protein TatC